jgi:hypothetical protein
MFEHKNQPLLNKKAYWKRTLKFGTISIILMLISIFIGIFGYHFLGNIGWIDSFYNASMILTGMGPVSQLSSNSAKIFSSFYAIYSGVAFLVMVGVLFAPAFHRFFHKLHMDIPE